MLTFTQYLQKQVAQFKDVEQNYAQMLFNAKLLANAKKEYNKNRESACLSKMSQILRLAQSLKQKPPLVYLTTQEQRDLVTQYFYHIIRPDDMDYSDIDPKCVLKIKQDVFLASVPLPFYDCHDWLEEIDADPDIRNLAKKLKNIKKFSPQAIKKAIF
ncbi:MAG TPA: hypothetical protein VK158_03735 [Acidobacteriota bacterium]|nr:hypothetical protein [Acidobacteriota bacterium]